MVTAGGSFAGRRRARPYCGNGAKASPATGHRSNEGNWLPFLNTYRTMCVSPEPEFRQVLEEIRWLDLAA